MIFERGLASLEYFYYFLEIQGLNSAFKNCYKGMKFEIKFFIKSKNTAPGLFKENQDFF